MRTRNYTSLFTERRWWFGERHTILLGDWQELRYRRVGSVRTRTIGRNEVSLGDHPPSLHGAALSDAASTCMLVRPAARRLAAL